MRLYELHLWWAPWAATGNCQTDLGNHSRRRLPAGIDAIPSTTVRALLAGLIFSNSKNETC